jgi:hypothetical protein
MLAVEQVVKALLRPVWVVAVLAKTRAVPAHQILAAVAAQITIQLVTLQAAQADQAS